MLYELCSGEWNVPALRAFFEETIPTHVQVDGFEIDIHFADLGKRTLLLNARVVASQERGGFSTLLVIKDITAGRQIELEKQILLSETEELLQRQRTLLKEMQHRVANSLQIIASILMLKAKGVASQETRDSLREAHQRVISVAEVQAHLSSVDGIDQIDPGAYLTKLCHGLAASMTSPTNPIAIEVAASGGTVGSSQAVSLGLMVTELVINAIKYAFPAITPGACITVGYESSETEWRLSVADNGVGNDHPQPSKGGGLGTAIVAALAKQLGGELHTVSRGGLTVIVAGRSDSAGLPLAA
jgi:two-component sensor histidine kinase